MTTLRRVVSAALIVIISGPVGPVARSAPVNPPSAPVAARVMQRAEYPVAPTTAAGFARLFGGLDPAEWGGADVAASVPLPDGRSVWLFGDTLSTSRFVHSTAVVQTGGELHVSHGGSQLLPDDDAHHVYWIVSGAARDARHLLIIARSTVLVGTGPWAFRDGGFSRTALAEVTTAGDVVFERWLEANRCPAPDPGPMYALDSNPHHFGYARTTHPEFAMASGKTLVTTCQNWDDGRVHPLSDYQPIFTER